MDLTEQLQVPFQIHKAEFSVKIKAWDSEGSVEIEAVWCQDWDRSRGQCSRKQREPSDLGVRHAGLAHIENLWRQLSSTNQRARAREPTNERAAGQKWGCGGRQHIEPAGGSLLASLPPDIHVCRSGGATSRHLHKYKHTNTNRQIQKHKYFMVASNLRPDIQVYHAIKATRRHNQQKMRDWSNSGQMSQFRLELFNVLKCP